MKIREIINFQHKIIEIIEENPLGWFGHLKKPGSYRIQKMILEQNAQSRKRKVKQGMQQEEAFSTKTWQKKMQRMVNCGGENFFWLNDSYCIVKKKSSIKALVGPDLYMDLALVGN